MIISMMLELFLDFKQHGMRFFVLFCAGWRLFGSMATHWERLDEMFTIEIVNFPMENRDFPMKNGDVP